MDNVITDISWVRYPILLIHIVSGFIGMYAGLVPLFTRKGGASHRRWGLVFVWGLGVASITALPLAFWHRDVFQAAIGLLTGYLVVVSVRSLRVTTMPRPYLDWTVVIVAMSTFLIMAGAGIVELAIAASPNGRATVVFGLLGLLVSVRNCVALMSQTSTLRQRVLDHMLASSLALICAVASFLNTQLHRLTGLDWPLEWRMLLPVICGAPLLVYFFLRWSQKLRGAKHFSDIDQKQERPESARLRFFAYAEGASLLVLVCLAVPLKHFGGHSELVRLMGPIHGALFILYVVSVMLARRSLRWSTSFVTWALVASLIPGGTFVFDAMLRRRTQRSKPPSFRKDQPSQAAAKSMQPPASITEGVRVVDPSKLASD